MREAAEVLLLLHKTFRASRKIRALWLLENLGKEVCIDSSEHEFDKGVELVGIIPKDGGNVKSGEAFRICTDTIAIFLSKAYRLIFILDLSPSAFAVDVSSKTLVHKKLLDNLERTLIGVTTPFFLPGVKRSFSPKLFVTICVYTPYLQFAYDSVFVQGLSLDADNVKQTIDIVRGKCEKFADSLCSFMRSSIGRYDRDRRIISQSRHSNTVQKHNNDPHSKRGEMPNLLSPKSVDDFGYIEPEYTFCSMLRIGLLSARLLPENTQSNVILITDGNVGKPNEEALQLLLNQLRNFTLSCSIIKLRRHATAGLACGDVTNSELFSFLASSTFGSYLTDMDLLENTAFSFGMNIYQKSLLSWSFQKSSIGNTFLEKFIETYNPEFASFCKRDMRRQKHITLEYEASLARILVLRIREGYFIRRIFFEKLLDNQSRPYLCIELCVPWRSMAFINYCIRVPWPFDPHRENLEITFCVEAPPCELDKIQNETIALPSPNELVADTLGSSFNSFIQADHCLTYLHSFTLGTDSYTVPSELEAEDAVFYLSSNEFSEPTLMLSKSLENPFKKKASVANFVKFWQSFCSFEEGIWQKWMHIHAIRLVLLHDTVLPLSLFMIRSSDKTYLRIECNEACAAFYKKLSEITSFHLLYKRIFVKFVHGEDVSAPPEYYYMICTTMEPPCVCLKIAFLCGIPAEIRAQTVADITRDLISVAVSRQVKINKKQSDGPNDIQSTEVPAVTIIHRPLERILALYRDVPPALNSFIRLDSSSNKRESILHNAVVRYLCCSRRLYHLPRIHPQIYTREGSADYILRTLLLRRIEEGFSVTTSANGIVSLCKEVKPEKDEYYGSALQQYILFPPLPLMVNGTTYTISKPGDAYLREVPDRDRDYAIVTELWVEPLGTIDEQLEKKANRHYETINETDGRIIKALSTFDQLMTLSEAFREKHEIFLCPSLVNIKPQTTFYNTKIQSISSSFCLTTLLENAGEAKVIFLPTLTYCNAEDPSSLQRVQLLLECLHDQLLASNNYCMEVFNSTTWTYFTQNVINCPVEPQIQGAKQPLRISSFKKDFKVLLQSPKTPLLLYVSHTSPWHMVLTIIPTSPQHVIDMKQGESLSIPVIICLCDEPWIASNLASLEPEPPIRKTSDARIKFAVSPLADLHRRTHDVQHREQRKNIDSLWISTARAPLEYINAPGYEYVSCDIRDYCAYLEDRLFSRAFTKAVYRAVNEGIHIDCADVNAVIELHSEQESLKIEDFDHCLGFLCAHIAEFRKKCGTFDNVNDDKETASLQRILSRFSFQHVFKSSRGDKSCEEEHRSFKTSFSGIIDANFRMVSNSSDFFYYRDTSVIQALALVRHPSGDTDQLSLEPVFYGADGPINGIRSTWLDDSTSNLSDENLASYSCIDVRPYKYNAEAPFFFKFECTVRMSEEDVITFPVSYIPSCILNILGSIDSREILNLDDLLEVSLHITVITWPRLDYIFDSSTYPWLRSGRKSSTKLKKCLTFEENGLSTVADDEQEPPGVLDGLSAIEKDALESLQRKIFRLVEFETVLAMSRYGSPEREDLMKIVNFINDQIEMEEDTTHFKVMKLNLSFVSNHERAFWRLRKRMEALGLDYCYLCQVADPVVSSTTFPLYYYCCSVIDKELFRERYLTLRSNFESSPSEDFNDMSYSPLEERNRQFSTRREDSLEKSQALEKKSSSQPFTATDLSRTNSATAFTSSEDGSMEKKVSSDSYRTGESQDSVGDFFSKCELFDFWLILTLDPFTATISFCQRYNHLHEGLFSLLCDSLKSEWRIINQKTLLEHMFRSRYCDALLVPKDEDVLKFGRSYVKNLIETRSFTSSLSSTWSKKVWEIYSQGGTVPLPIAKCTAGQFTCEIVRHHWFFVHPRLRENCIANREDPLSFALEVLKSQIEKWNVKNRSNMYIMKENDDLFYLRIHADASTVYESSIEPNNSWMTKMNKEFETKVLLTVHGCCSPGAEIESVIEKMEKSLMRKTMEALKDSIQVGQELNLYPEDIEYLQSNPSAPERIFSFTLPRVTEKFLGTIFYYLCQQLSMYAVPIVDPTGFTSYHSDFHPPALEEKKIFYALNHKAGLGCIQLRLVLPDGTVKSNLDYARFDKDAFSQLSPVWNMSQIGLRAFLARLSSLPVQESYDKYSGRSDFSSLAQFVLWVEGGTEQSLVPIQSICRLVVNQALCDLITEFGLFGKAILEFTAPPSPGPAPIRCRDDRKSGDISTRRPSGDTTCSVLSAARNSFTNVRSSLSNPRISTTSSRSQSSQPDVSGKPLLNPLIRRLSQNNMIYEPSLDETMFRQEKPSPVYVTAKFNAIAADWFDHVLAELKSRKEDQYSLKKHSFRMDSDYAARKILQVVERRLAAALPTETVTVFVADPKGTKRLASVDNTEELFKRVDLDVGRVQSNDRKITAGGQQEPREAKMALMIYNQEFDEAMLDYGADVSKNEEVARTVLEQEKDNKILRFEYSLQPFVPRRRLLYMTFSHDECDLYIYNYEAGKAEEVYKIVATAAFWLNGRSYLIREISLDKMGITHLHQDFQLVMDPSLIHERKVSASQGSIEGSCGPDYEKALLWLNAKALTKYSFPDEDDPQFNKLFRDHCDSSLEAQLRMKLYTYFQCPNSYLLMLKFYKEQCRQMVDLENDVDVLLRTHDRFHKLYHTLLSGSPEIAENDLLELIERSREVYFEKAPLLFYPRWRSCLAPVRIGAKGTVELPGPPKSADFSKISQHPFFSSMPSFTSSKPPTPTSSKPTTPSQFQKPARSMRYSSAFEPVSSLLRENPDPFVVKLEFMFIEEYIKYLESLGLTLLEVTNICSLSKEMNYYTTCYNAEMTRKSPNVWLCKALNAGIIFVNLTFSKPHFSVRVLFWDESQQRHSVMGRSHCSIDKVQQTDAGLEKDLIVALLYVQSYTYDFHLRMIAKYLVGGTQVLFDPGYDTHALLINFMYCFKSRPSRSRSAILEGTLKITDLPVDENVVWNYLLVNNDKSCRVVALRSGSDTPIRYMIVWEEVKEIFRLPYKIVSMCLQETFEKPRNCLKLCIYTILVSDTKTNPFVDFNQKLKRKKILKKNERIRVLHGKLLYKIPRKRIDSPKFLPGSNNESLFVEVLDYEKLFVLRRNAANSAVRQKEFGSFPIASEYRQKVCIQRSRPYRHHAHTEVESLNKTKDDTNKPDGRQLTNSPKKLCSPRSPVARQLSLRKRHSLLGKRSTNETKQLKSAFKEPSFSQSAIEHSSFETKRLYLGSEPFCLDDKDKFTSFGERGVFLNYVCSREKALQMQLEKYFASFKRKLISLVKDASWQCKRDKLWVEMFASASLSSAGNLSVEKAQNLKFASQLLPELRQVYSSAITTADVDELLTYSSVISLSNFDSNFESLSRDFAPDPFFRAIVRNFGAEKCRLFCSDVKKHLVVAAEGQSVFLFSVIGKHPLEMRLVHKKSEDAQRVIQNGRILDASLSLQLEKVLQVIASYCWLELTATPVIGKVR